MNFYEKQAVEQMFDLLQNMIWPLLGMGILNLAASLLLAFCVYYDARSRRDRLAIMWAVLSGFFGIAALVYVIVRCVSKPKLIPCVRCGQWMPSHHLFCASCGQPVLENGYPVDPQVLDQYRRRSKILLIVWICVAVVAFIGGLAIFLNMFSEMLQIYKNGILYW